MVALIAHVLSTYGSTYKFCGQYYPLWSLWQDSYLSREVLPTVVCLSMISRPQQSGGLG